MVPRKQAGHMTCTRPQAERQNLLAMRASSTHDPISDIPLHGRELCYDSSGDMEFEEWPTMATYSIGDLSRREILRMSAVLGSASAASTRFAIAQTAGQRTPEQILGPFYSLKALDQHADLTMVAGRPGRAAGLVLNVGGRVLTLKGEPVRDA